MNRRGQNPNPDAVDRLERVFDDDDDDESPVGAEDNAPAPAVAPDQELDGLRIHQLSTLRRAAYRARSHAVIAMIICAVAVAQLVTMAWRNYRAAGAIDRWVIVSAALATAAVAGAIYFARRAVALHDEATRPHLPPDRAEAPDFAALGDGSETWKHLDDVR